MHFCFFIVPHGLMDLAQQIIKTNVHMRCLYAVGVYVMAMQLCLHGPLLCGFFFSKDKLWSIAQFITNLSTFCNVFEILAVAELRDDGGKIVVCASANSSLGLLIIMFPLHEMKQHLWVEVISCVITTGKD